MSIFDRWESTNSQLFSLKLNIKFIPSVCNFICIDMAQTALPIYEALLQEGVIVRPLGGYGMPNHLRVTIGTHKENERFLQALEKVLNNGLKM